MEDQQPGRDVGAQIRNIGRILREQWWIILLCIVVTTFAAAAYTSTQEKKYQATAKLLLQTDNLSSTVAGTSIGGAVDPTRQAATDAQLVTSPAVTARVRSHLKQPLGSAQVSTSANPDANILTVSVTDSKPARAAAIANEYARQYIVFRRDTTRQRYNSALRTVEAKLARSRKNTPDFQTLRAQVKQLKLLVSLQNGDAQIVQRASPPAGAVSPDPVRNIAIGVIVGALLGIGLAFLRDRLDRRIKRPEDLEALLPGVPVIGLVPEPGRGRTSRLMTAEGFHSLQANLTMLAHGRPLNTLLVTSASPGDGKSTVALNLALAFIEKGEKALVVDADLRRPTITARLEAEAPAGVSTILSGQGTLDTTVQEREVEPSRNGNGPPIALAGSLPIVPAGPAAPNVQLLLNDRSLGVLLEAAREREGHVIFDGPPVGAFADMLPLAGEVDGVIVVTRLFHTRSDELGRLTAQLANASIEPVGVVVLGAAAARSRYYAGYLAKR